MENYHDLKIEIKRIRNWRLVKIIPIIIGSLGTISRDFEKWLKLLEMPCSMEILQRACLLGSGKILRKVLDTRTVPRRDYKDLGTPSHRLWLDALQNVLHMQR